MEVINTDNSKKSNLLIIDEATPRDKITGSIRVIGFIGITIIISLSVWLYFVLNPKSPQQQLSTSSIPALLPNKIINTRKISPTLLPIPTVTFTPTPTETPTPSPIPTDTPTPTPSLYNAPSTNTYSNRVISTEKGNFSLKIISVDLNQAKMLTVTANDDDCPKDCPTKSLSDFAKENTAFAGINGTYFCPPDYSECASKKNSFDFPVYNSKTSNWINFKNLNWNDRAMIIQDEKGLRFSRKPDKERFYKVTHVGDDWYTGYTRSLEPTIAAIVNAPGLLENGNVITDQYPLTDKQKSKGIKAGIGFKDKNIFLVIASSATMNDLAYIFKALGATDALNLDAGGSTAMWYEGSYLAGPGRRLPNAIIFTK